MPVSVLLSSMLLEPLRWAPGRQVSLRVSDWSDRASIAGFDGWELFENHGLSADEAELAALAEGQMPVTVFHSCAGFEDIGAEERIAAAAVAQRLGVRALQFNVGKDAGRLEEYRRNVAALVGATAGRPSLWCECESGTLLERPERVLGFLRGFAPVDFDVVVHPFAAGPNETLHWLRLLGPRVRHAHVQMRARNDPGRFIALADDAPRARECLAALREGGFDGSLTIECAAPIGGAHDRPQALFAAACRDLEFLRTHWR